MEPRSPRITCADAPVLFRLCDDLVVVQSGGEVELIRFIAACSTEILRSPRSMVLHLVAHFRSPNTAKSWIDIWDAAAQCSADRLLQTCISHGYLVPADQDGRGAVGCGEAEIDTVVQSIVVMADRLRGDIRMLRGFDRISAGAPKLTSLLHACHHTLKRLTDQVDQARIDFIDAQLAAVAAQSVAVDGKTRLHLGCGEHHIAGWVNVDIAGGDIRLDLRRGLPYATGSVTAVYLAHLLEHLDYKEEALALLQETRRVLRPGALLRVVVPNIESFARAYVASDVAFFTEFERLWQRPKSDSPLACFLHYAGAGGFPAIMDRHRFGYDALTLGALLIEAGFKEPRVCRAGDSAIDEPGLDYSWATAASASGRPFGLIMEAHVGSHGVD